jgi:predicted HAD superfamily Cof-like phosphohydrolase
MIEDCSRRPLGIEPGHHWIAHKVNDRWSFVKCAYCGEERKIPGASEAERELRDCEELMAANGVEAPPPECADRVFAMVELMRQQRDTLRLNHELLGAAFRQMRADMGTEKEPNMKIEIEAEMMRRLLVRVAELGEANEALQKRNTELVELRRVESIRDAVTHFHRVMDIPVLDHPQVPSDERVRLRLRLIAEEFFEVLWACGICLSETVDLAYLSVMKRIREDQINVDLPALADNLCDLDYVTEGARLEFGIRGAEVLAEVQRANLAKVGGPKRADGKVLKPEGWQAPDIARVLREQGWRP